MCSVRSLAALAKAFLAAQLLGQTAQARYPVGAEDAQMLMFEL